MHFAVEPRQGRAHAGVHLAHAQPEGTEEENGVAEVEDEWVCCGRVCVVAVLFVEIGTGV